MTSIPQVAEAMHHVLDAIAYTLGRTTGFVQRERKLHGASFAQTLVFSFLANPAAASIISCSTTPALLGRAA